MAQRVGWYIVAVKTGNRPMGGTDANVKIILTGQKTNSGYLELRDSLDYNDKFEKNHLDRFKFQLADLGQMVSVTIGQDNKGPLSGWHLDMVEVSDQKANKKYRFVYNAWLNSKRPEVTLTNPQVEPGCHDTTNMKAANRATSKHNFSIAKEGLGILGAGGSVIAGALSIFHVTNKILASEASSNVDQTANVTTEEEIGEEPIDDLNYEDFDGIDSTDYDY